MRLWVRIRNAIQQIPTLPTVLLSVSVFAINIQLLYGYGNQNRSFYGYGNEKVPSLLVTSLCAVRLSSSINDTCRFRSNRSFYCVYWETFDHSLSHSKRFSHCRQFIKRLNGHGQQKDWEAREIMILPQGIRSNNWCSGKSRACYHAYCLSWNAYQQRKPCDGDMAMRLKVMIKWHIRESRVKRFFNAFQTASIVEIGRRTAGHCTVNIIWAVKRRTLCAFARHHPSGHFFTAKTSRNHSAARTHSTWRSSLTFQLNRTRMRNQSLAST